MLKLKQLSTSEEEVGYYHFCSTGHPCVSKTPFSRSIQTTAHQYLASITDLYISSIYLVCVTNVIAKGNYNILSPHKSIYTACKKYKMHVQSNKVKGIERNVIDTH